MLASHNSMQKKDDMKRATKPLIKKKGKEKKRAREKHDSIRKKIWLLRTSEKQKCSLITSD